MLDYEGRVADDGAEKFLLGDLFEVGEAEFGEEFLCAQVSTLRGGQARGKHVPCSGPGQLLETPVTGYRKRRWRHQMCGGK